MLSSGISLATPAWTPFATSRASTTIQTRTLLDDWAEYADRLLLAALSARNAGNSVRFSELMASANAMWNGRGIADKYYLNEHCYQTYHVALYFLASGNPAALQALLAQQVHDPASVRCGGIYTEYGDDRRPLANTDVNVETTALTLRALGWTPNWTGIASLPPQ